MNNLRKFTAVREKLDNWIWAALALGLDFEVQHDGSGWLFTTSGEAGE